MTAPNAKVRRDGQVVSIPASGIVAGDILSLERDLGRSRDQPPFTSPTSASSGGLDYRRLTTQYTGGDEPIPVSAIAVD